jgi:hypothetical protein
MSKSWLGLTPFEFSSLQKPLLYFILAPIHLIPAINDIQHIMVAKGLFTVLGTGSLLILSYLVIQNKSKTNKNEVFFKMGCYLFLTLLFSPSLSFNFTAIRSDQLSFFLLILSFLIISFGNYLKTTLLLILILPLAGVKSLIFLPAGFIYFILSNSSRFSIKQKIFYSTVIISIVVWMAALNPDAIRYLIDIYLNRTYQHKWDSVLYRFEATPFIISFFILIYKIIKNKYDSVFNFSFISTYFFIFYLFYPQKYEFFVASIIPFALLTAFSFFDDLLKNMSSRTRAVLLIAFIMSGVGIRSFFKFDFYRSSSYQFKYIKYTAPILKQYNLTYIDGIGIYPRQNLGNQPCFSSPTDNVSNNNCLSRLKKQDTDVVISTSRLTYVDPNVPKMIENDYIQILPNFWVKKEIQNKFKIKTDLQIPDLMPAFLIF